MVELSDNFFVTAVLVTHDGATWLPQVIAALSAQTRRIDRIISVDTGSHDASVKLLRAAGIVVVEAERNIGYGDAIEIALEHAPTDPTSDTAAAEWIWLIHDDCAPASDALEIMLGELAERPQVVIAGPKLLGWYDRDHLLEAGISIAINGSRWTGLGQREQDQGQQNFTREVLSVSTAAMLVRRSAFVELGGLDPNLALFRDDVDLGWRAHVAGLGAICVGRATVFHAEASASERRVVDVSEAFLHRPLLLDRRNAAYVLLVNSSWWMLPWVSLQLLGTSLLRALYDLVAKLPGYAGDEIAAIGLLLIHPRELFIARSARRKKRLLSPGVVKRFIPPRGSQIRLGLDHVTSLLLDSVARDRSDDGWQSELQSSSFTELGTIDDEFDTPDLSAPIRASIFKNFIRRPDFLAIVFMSLLSLLAGRNRFGQLSGGALSLVPTHARDLFHFYLSAWHPVGMGSSNPAPTWTLIFALASIITLGHLALLVNILFFITPPLAFYIFSRIARSLGVTKNFATVGGFIYVLNPLLWGALNQGRIGTVTLFLLLPVVLLIKPFDWQTGSFTSRRLFALTLLIALIGALSPLLLAIWLLGQVVMLALEIFRSRVELKEVGLRNLIESEVFAPIGRRATFIATPLLLLSPWSFDLLLHPTHWLAAPGVPLSGGGVASTLLFNPGGAGSSPLWLIAPVFLCVTYIALIRALSSLTLILSALLGGAILLSAFHVSAHGSTSNVWSGELLLVATIIVIPPLLQQAKDVIPTLRTSKFGVAHISVGAAVTALSISALAMSVWIVGSANNSQVRGNQPSVVPAFVGALADTPSRPKTVVLSVVGNSTSYFISSGSELSMGDADVADKIPNQIQDAMTQLVTGSGLATSKVLGSFGIQYLFIKAPTPVSLSTLIDGIGGFVRISSTANGTMWKILHANSRVEFVSANGARSTLTSGSSDAVGTVSSAGQLTLAQVFDSNWRLLDNGKSVPEEKNASGLPVFTVPGGGSLVLSYDGTIHRALLSLQFLALLVAIVMALPSGRRKVEVPLEELV